MVVYTPTHKGQLIGDARTGDKRPWVHLVERKQHWVVVRPNGQLGSKYRKTSGSEVTSNKWPVWMLDTNTVQKLEG